MTQQQTQTLLDRYLDGLTTDAEEGQLRCYFAQTDIVPPEWRSFKALFDWEVRAATCRPATIEPERLHRPVRRHRPARRWAAAVAVLMVGTVLTAIYHHTSQTSTLNYQLSTLNSQLSTPNSQLPTPNYAVIDGQVVTSTDIVAREAEHALTLVTATDADTYAAIDLLNL